MMETKTLLNLKKEIIECQDTHRLLELEINLKHFCSLFSQKIKYEEALINEIEIKDMKNSISLANSYLFVISWKLTCIKLEKENNKINSLIENKNEIFKIFEMTFTGFLANYLNSKQLKSENAVLKKKVKEMKSATKNSGT